MGHHADLCQFHFRACCGLGAVEGISLCVVAVAHARRLVPLDLLDLQGGAANIC